MTHAHTVRPRPGAAAVAVAVESAPGPGRPRPGVQALVERGIQMVPEAYIRPVNQRPLLGPSHPNGCFRITTAGKIPVVDLARLSDSDGTIGRKQTMKAIARACEEWGFFQVINHGIPDHVLDDTLDLAKRFFSLPLREKATYNSGPGADPSIHPSSGSFGSTFPPPQDSALDWRDVLQHCFINDDATDDKGQWPQKPHAYKQIMLKYREAIQGLAERLLVTIAQNLGLERDHINRIVGKSTSLVNLIQYPQCPEPELVLGVRGHSDPSVISLLLQDEVGGLEVRAKDGQWVLVQPIPQAIVVNAGDILQVISNGRYPSVEHRVVVNGMQSRLSVATYYCPHSDSKIGPAPGLTTEDQPPRYRDFFFSEYVSALYTPQATRNRSLESFYIN